MKLFLKKIFVFSSLIFLMSIINVFLWDKFIYQQGEEFTKKYLYKNQSKIILGASHGRHLNIKNFYNFCSGSQTLDLSYLIINDLIESNNKIDEIILTISPFSFDKTSKNKSFNVRNNYPQTKDNVFFRYFKDNEKLSRIFKLFKDKTKTKTKSKDKNTKWRKHHLGDGSNSGKYFLDSILSVTKKFNIKLNVVITPYTKEYLRFIESNSFWDSDKKKLKNLDRLNQINFYDFSEYFNQRKDYWKYFYDLDHMTFESGQELSVVITNNINEGFK